jgi:hypothetical protein
MPIAEATYPTVLITVAPAATAGRGHGRPKKVIVPSLVKPKKKLMPEERASKSRK